MTRKENTKAARVIRKLRGMFAGSHMLERLEAERNEERKLEASRDKGEESKRTS